MELKLENPGGAPLTERERFADCVEAIADRRDWAAFSALFRHYAPRIKHYVRRLGANDALAEELAQDVMVTLWRKAALFDRRQASVSTWIFRIARNRRIDALRRGRRPDLDPHDPALTPPLEDAPDAGLTTGERERLLRTAMADLPGEQLELLQAAFYDGLSHREIAERSGLPLGTVKSRIRLAFNKLRARLAGEV